jgi:hypothetical protein
MLLIEKGGDFFISGKIEHHEIELPYMRIGYIADPLRRVSILQYQFISNSLKRIRIKEKPGTDNRD